MSNNESTIIKIMGQEYHVKGTDVEYMENLAAGLDGRLKELKNQYPLYSSNKVAILLLIQLQDECNDLSKDYNNLLKEIELLKI